MNSPSKGRADYWNKRLNRVAAKPTVAEFVLELNRRLREDPAFRAGVRFVVVRSHGNQEMPSWEGPSEARALISRVLQLASNDVEMPAPFQMDPLDTDA